MKYLAVDIGSTYTKLTAVDSGSGRIVGTAGAFTTIDTDVMEGYAAASAALHAQTGGFAHDALLCCSSAAGGLKMVALGLVPELTAKAAKLAASSAGAKVVATYAYEISPEEQEEIRRIDPDLILLCGGTDGGNKEVIIANARILCGIEGRFSIIAAGNKVASRELEEIFTASGKEHVITGNVMPVFGSLDIEPARQSIRDLFIRRIIDAKGLSRMQAMSACEVIPTPLAVMKACELLSLGTAKTPGIGDFLAIDAGGATTDVYSMSKGEPSLANVVVKGIQEPFSKRTVEGDIGMRYSLRALYDGLDADAFAEENGFDRARVEAWVRHCGSNPGAIAAPGSLERRIDEALARSGIAAAVERHCGVMEKIYTPMGEMFVLRGKDLSLAPYIIGIGGVLKNSLAPAGILSGAKYTPVNPMRMLPKNPRYMLDEQYIFSAMGLVGMVDPELALHMMKQEILLLPEA